MERYLAVVPWLIEAFWLWQWVPVHARRLRKQRELKAVLGPEFFDISQPASEFQWFFVFALYHLPLMLIGLAVPFRTRRRYPWLILGLAMLGTPVLYSGVVVYFIR